MKKAIVLLQSEISYGLSINDIVRKFGISERCVRAILFDGSKRLCQKTINKIIDTTTYYRTIRATVKRYFATVNTEDKAYMLGFFSYNDNAVKKYRATSKEELSEIITWITKIIGKEALNEKEFCCLYKEIFVQCNTNSITYLDLLKPNNPLSKHFIRGLFDNCRALQTHYDTKSNHTKSMFQFMTSDDKLRKSLSNALFAVGIKCSIPNSTRDFKILGNKKIRDMYAWLYDGSSIFLHSRRNVIEPIILKKPFNRKIKTNVKPKSRSYKISSKLRIPRNTLPPDVSDEQSFRAYLAQKISFRACKVKGGRGIGHSYICIWSNEHSDVIYNQLTGINIQSTIHNSIHPGGKRTGVNVHGMKELIKLHDFIYAEPQCTDFSIFISKLKIELDNRRKLFAMLKHDFFNGLNQVDISSKYNLNKKTVDRIVRKNLDEHKTLTNATPILDTIGPMIICDRCNVYAWENEACDNCVAISKKIKRKRNIQAMQRDYGGQVRTGLWHCLIGIDTSNLTIQNYTGWTFRELKKHLEEQFEPWMTWDNRGKYVYSSWDDNDSSTWIWQIDHIKPVSEFEFKTKTDPGFKECWALSNLRPLSAKQNQIDGATRIRHTKT